MELGDGYKDADRHFYITSHDVSRTAGFIISAFKL
jgi:hypothetical protein